MEVPAQWHRSLVLLVLLVAGILLLYRETVVAMVEIWSRSDTFAHAFLVPPISAWLIWRGRDRLVNLVPRPALGWLLPMALAALAWLLGDLVTVNAVTQFALVTLLVTAVPLTLGWAATRAMLFPLLFLYFSVPFGDFLLPWLMEGTADFTVGALRLSGIPVFREGLQFVIPSGNWSVVEACSGVRYLIASFMVGSLFAYLNYQSMARRFIFVGVSIIVPIVANWLRAYMIVMLGHLSDNRIATGVDHLIYGWVFFGVVITILFMIGARWAEPDRAAIAPKSVTGNATPLAGWANHGTAMLVAAALLVAPHVAERFLQQHVNQSAVDVTWPVAAAGAWTLASTTSNWQPRYEGPSSQLQATYSRNGQTVGVYVAYYRAQGPGRKLVSSQNVMVTSEDRLWHAVGTARVESDVGGQPMSWRRTHLLGVGGVSHQRAHKTIWSTNWVDGELIDRDALAKVRGATGALAGRGDDGAAIVLHTAGEPDVADAVLADFAQAHLVALRQALERARLAR